MNDTAMLSNQELLQADGFAASRAVEHADSRAIEVRVEELGTAELVDADAAADPLTADAPGSQDQMTPQELADLCLDRATTYGLLAQLFREEVTQELFDELCAMHYPVDTGNDLMDQGYYLIAKYLSNAWVEPVNELSVDFSKTFLGSGIDAHSAAYPFESVYTSEKRLLMQDARDEVLAIYRANGLNKSESWKVGEDHIAVEMEFMRILNTRAAKAIQADDQDRAFSLINTQRNFLADHIAVWVPVFTSDVRRFAQTDFYKGVADLAEGFLEEDLFLLDSLVELGEDDEQ